MSNPTEDLIDYEEDDLATTIVVPVGAADQEDSKDQKGSYVCPITFSFRCTKLSAFSVLQSRIESDN
jgi:hypothetical protein